MRPQFSQFLFLFVSSRPHYSLVQRFALSSDARLPMVFAAGAIVRQVDLKGDSDHTAHSYRCDEMVGMENLLRTSTFKTDFLKPACGSYISHKIEFSSLDVSVCSELWSLYFSQSLQSSEQKLFFKAYEGFFFLFLFFWHSDAIPCSPSDVPSRSLCPLGPTLPWWQCCWAEPLLHSSETPRDLKSTHTNTHTFAYLSRWSIRKLSTGKFVFSCQLQFISLPQEGSKYYKLLL